MTAPTTSARRFLQAALRLTRGLLGMPARWRVWLLALVLANLVVPLAMFPDHREAQVVIATFLAGATLMTVLTMLTGFSRLLGLAHVLWFPLLYYLWTRTSAIGAEEPYGVWLRAVMVVDAISLALDVTDVARYVAGERADLSRERP